MRPNKFDWLIYRIFRWWWNPILKNNPNLALQLAGFIRYYVSAQQGFAPDGANADPIERDWSGDAEDKAWAYLQDPPRR